MLDKTAQWIARLFEVVAVSLLALMSFFVVLSSFMRYVLGAPFSFTEDFVGLLFCAIVFLVLPSVQEKGRHIVVDLFSYPLRHWFGKLQLLGRSAMILLFAVWFGREAFLFAQYAYQNGSKTLVADIPIYPWVAVLTLSVAIMGLLALKQCIDQFAGKNQEETEGSAE